MQSVMYGSADRLRSLSSMITVLINMCFIAPLTHTTGHTLHSETGPYSVGTFLIVYKKNKVIPTRN